jgi:hypothetical protein
MCDFQSDVSVDLAKRWDNRADSLRTVSNASGKNEFVLAQKKYFYIIMGNWEEFDQQAIAFNQGGSLLILN